jgi:hypothetical protein
MLCMKFYGLVLWYDLGLLQCTFRPSWSIQVLTLVVDASSSQDRHTFMLSWPMHVIDGMLCCCYYTWKIPGILEMSDA